MTVKIRNMVLCGLFTALITLCAWLSIPLGDVAITLQTFAVFLCLRVLGGKLGTLTVLVYLLLGAVGIPVFSGFRGGFGALLGPTGGYLTGFLACGLIYWLLTSLFPTRQTAALLAGLMACYVLGCLWYYHIYLSAGGSGTITVILIQTLLLYLPPDIVKLFLARQLSKRILEKISP